MHVQYIRRNCTHIYCWKQTCICCCHNATLVFVVTKINTKHKMGCCMQPILTACLYWGRLQSGEVAICCWGCWLVERVQGIVRASFRNSQSCQQPKLTVSSIWNIYICKYVYVYINLQNIKTIHICVNFLMLSQWLSHVLIVWRLHYCKYKKQLVNTIY